MDGRNKCIDLPESPYFVLNVPIKQVRMKIPALMQCKIPTKNDLKLNIDGASKGNLGQ